MAGALFLSFTSILLQRACPVPVPPPPHTPHTPPRTHTHAHNHPPSPGLPASPWRTPLVQRLLDDRFFDRVPSILITAKGMPDMATRCQGLAAGGGGGEVGCGAGQGRVSSSSNRLPTPSQQQHQGRLPATAAPVAAPLPAFPAPANAHPTLQGVCACPTRGLPTPAGAGGGGLEPQRGGHPERVSGVVGMCSENSSENLKARHAPG